MAGPPIFDADEPKKILNVHWDIQVADLINRNPNGPISGYRWDGKKEQQWYIQPAGPAEYRIKSAAFDNVYANTFKELNGVPLVGYTQAVNWKIIPVDLVKATFRITTLDEKYTWVLEKGENYYAILLRDDQDNQNNPEAHWRIVEP